MGDKPPDKFIEGILSPVRLYEYAVFYEIDDEEGSSESINVGKSEDFVEAQNLARLHAVNMAKGAIAAMIEQEELDLNLSLSDLIEGIFDEDDTKAYLAGQLISVIKANYSPFLDWEPALSADDDLERIYDNVAVESDFGNGRYRITRKALS